METRSHNPAPPIVAAVGEDEKPSKKPSALARKSALAAATQQR
jgi:hypothetical protein